MAISKFNKAKIAGIVSCIPRKIIKIDDELQTVYNNDINKLNRIKKSIGLNKRHVTESHETTADLCEAAAKPDTAVPCVPPPASDRLSVPVTYMVLSANSGWAVP